MRKEAGNSDEANPAITEPAPHIRGVAGSCSKTPAQAAPYLMPAQETPEALAAEIGATRGEPCEKCGCALYRNMAEYQVCIRCYPLRGYHVYSAWLDAL